MPLSLRHESSRNIRSAEGLSDTRKGNYEVAAAVLYLKRRAIREPGDRRKSVVPWPPQPSMTLFGVSSGEHFRDQPLGRPARLLGLLRMPGADDGHPYTLRQQTLAPTGAWDLVSFREEKSK